MSRFLFVIALMFSFGFERRARAEAETDPLVIRARAIAGVGIELKKLCAGETGTRAVDRFLAEAKDAVAADAKLPEGQRVKGRRKDASALDAASHNLKRACTDFASNTARFDLRGFDFTTSIIVAATDWASVSALFVELKPLVSAEELAWWSVTNDASAELTKHLGVTGTSEATSELTALATTALAGLAKLIEERARFEAIGWFLEQLGDRLCRVEATDPTDQRVASEMSTHFIPALCTLANKKQLWEYGAGGALWQSLQTAARADLKNLPGALAGTATLALTDQKGALLGCHMGAAESVQKRPPPSKECQTATALRRETRARVTSLLDGEEATVVLEAWAKDLEAASALSEKTRTIEVAACVAAIPGFVRRRRAAFEKASLSNDPNVSAVSNWQAALMVGALAGTESCQRLNLGFKLGLKRECVTPSDRANRSECKCVGPSCAAGLWDAAAPAASEKLTNALALAKLLGKAEALANAVDAWVLAKQRFDAATKPDAPKPPALNTELSVTAEADPSAVKAAVEALSAKSTDAAAKADAIFNLADASLKLAIASIDLLDHAIAVSTEDAPTIKPFLADIKLHLGRLSRAVTIARSAVKGEWATVVSEAVTLTSAWLDENWLASADQGSLKHVLASAKDLAVLVSIASTGDADAMAKALDALADPPGGWRTKREPRSFTVSLTSHAGVLGGFEQRWGPYGAVLETGDVYGQAPSLAMPTGLEFAWGFQAATPFSLNLMVWVLDPAAFLQYDASNEGRLPGPSPVTALSPGLELSLSVADTPFNIGLFSAFRPGYRQWEPDVSAGGAHVFQHGILASVDVTLFSFMSNRRAEKAK